MAKCPYCAGEAEKMGVLGNLIHYVCRQCGWQFAKQSKRKRPWWQS